MTLYIRSRQVKRLLGAGMFAVGVLCGGAFLGEAEAWRLARQEATAQQLAALTPLPQGKTVNYYTALADYALAVRPGDYVLAEQATGKILNRNSKDAQAWNRLAFIDLRENRQLTRDGVAALYKSYDASPYGDLAMMIWRVEFGSSVWSSLPDDLRARTLAQIPVIGRFGVSWEWRVGACRQNPHEQIWRAACDIAPGVVRPGTGGRPQTG
ncbi:hypothetical protein [Parvularcula sp. IMCC14364]|uniref:hypothetical protein n=1 Tax=Parvularcula sp. IMCC14364 TaxID=3067902 RepID=UPI0027411D5B|nr:hypothetical protein [Parvularcula sp. IMCC14364]